MFHQSAMDEAPIEAKPMEKPCGPCAMPAKEEAVDEACRPELIMASEGLANQS